MIRNWKLLWGLAIGIVSSPAWAAPVLHPLGSETFWMPPEQPSVLRWQLEEPAPDLTLGYRLHDYLDREVVSGTAIVRGAEAQATLQLHRGFFELEFPTLGQRFGVLVLPPQQGPADPFFAIDAALSWLVSEEAARPALLTALQRSGISLVRERVHWGDLQPSAGQWQWNVRGYDRLRQSYVEHGLKLLEVCHDAPPWIETRGTYPADLTATLHAWQTIAEHWRPTWGGVELWNEPDILFGAELPADQYLAMARPMSMALRSHAAGVPVVGGVLANWNGPWLDNAARNGLLEIVDAFSFHNYGTAEALETLIGKFRGWLAEHGHPGMPLWITECGKPWKKGTPRPTVDEDALSALEITMKAVEARACGIACYFPFVYPYYEEANNNFGMLGREQTPVRSMAAYAQAAARLAGKRYLGDLTGVDSTVQRARVFGDDRETVVVLYTGEVQADAQTKLNLPPVRVEGIDGRPLLSREAGAIPLPDGLSYVVVDRAALGNRLATDTAAMQLTRQAQARPTERRNVARPIVLRYEWDPAVIAARPDGYHLSGMAPAAFALKVRAYNLADQPQTVLLRLTLPSPDAQVVGPTEATLSVPPEKWAEATWTLDLRHAFAAEDRLPVTVQGDAAVVSPLGIDLLGEPSLEQLSARFPQHRELPLGPREAWQPAIPAGGQMSLDTTSEGLWRLTTHFGPGDRWVYPRRALPTGSDLSQFEGIVLRARCPQPSQVRLFLWEGESVGYLLHAEGIVADGQWHTALLRFSDARLSVANAPDPNGRLDLDQVGAISLGLNTKEDRALLEVSHLILVGR